MKHILLIAFLSPILALGQVITPVDLDPPSDTPRQGFQKLNTNDANIKARLDSIVNAGLGGGATTVPFDSITDLPPTLSEHGITDAWKTSGTTVLSSSTTVEVAAGDFEIKRQTGTNRRLLLSSVGSTLSFGSNNILQLTSSYTLLRFNNGISSQSVEMTSSGWFITDQINSRGMTYAADYSTNGISQHGNRWIPDYGAVKTYADTKVAASITNGVTTSAPNQDQVFDALALKQDVLTGLTSSVAELNALDGITSTVTELNYTDGVTSAIQTQIDTKLKAASTASTGTDVAFDIPRTYGYSADATGNITFTTTGLVEGITQLMIHNDSSEPTFETGMVVISGTYVTGEDNYIMFHAVSSSLILVTISQAQ